MRPASPLLSRPATAYNIVQMEKCYVINAPWVFYALWKGLTPLVSANTAKKVQVRRGKAVTRPADPPLRVSFSRLCDTVMPESLDAKIVGYDGTLCRRNDPAG